MTQEIVSNSLDARRVERMIHIRLGEALYNPVVLTDKYFIEFCTMLCSMPEVDGKIALALEVAAGCPQGTFSLWQDGSSLPPEGPMRTNIVIDILQELEFLLSSPA